MSTRSVLIRWAQWAALMLGMSLADEHHYGVYPAKLVMVVVTVLWVWFEWTMIAFETDPRRPK